MVHRPFEAVAPALQHGTVFIFAIADLVKFVWILGSQKSAYFRPLPTNNINRGLFCVCVLLFGHHAETIYVFYFHGVFIF